LAAERVPVGDVQLPTGSPATPLRRPPADVVQLPDYEYRDLGEWPVFSNRLHCRRMRAWIMMHDICAAARTARMSTRSNAHGTSRRRTCSEPIQSGSGRETPIYTVRSATTTLRCGSSWSRRSSSFSSTSPTCLGSQSLRMITRLTVWTPRRWRSLQRRVVTHPALVRPQPHLQREARALLYREFSLM
jgi:hypothetical protein